MTCLVYSRHRSANERTFEYHQEFAPIPVPRRPLPTMPENRITAHTFSLIAIGPFAASGHVTASCAHAGCDCAGGASAHAGPRQPTQLSPCATAPARAAVPRPAKIAAAAAASIATSMPAMRNITPMHAHRAHRTPAAPPLPRAGCARLRRGRRPHSASGLPARTKAWAAVSAMPRAESGKGPFKPLALMRCTHSVFAHRFDTLPIQDEHFASARMVPAAPIHMRNVR